MAFPKVFSNPRFKWVDLLLGFVFLVLLIINIFNIGGDSIIILSNSVLRIPLAVLNVVMAAIVWRMMASDLQNRRLWASIMVGWILWAVADSFRASGILIKQEIPQLLIIDLFWILGYFPILYGLISSIHSFQLKPRPLQRYLAWGFSLAVVTMTIIFILVPMLRNFKADGLWESIINLAYPVLDLCVVLIVLRLFFTFEQGDFGFSWDLLALGFIFKTISDLVFTWSTLNHQYYPAMQANLVSKLGVDVPNILAYILWFSGAFALSILYRQAPVQEPSRRIRMVRTYGHILCFIDSDDSVFEVSPNYASFFTQPFEKGMKLEQVLTLQPGIVQNILAVLHTRGTIADTLVQVRDNQGEEHTATINGLAIHDAQGAYTGANILLRTRVVDSSFDDILSHEDRAVTREILLGSGSTYLNEIGQFLADYYIVHIQSLLKMASHQGGDALVNSVMDKLQQTSSENNWDLQFDPQGILDHTRYPVSLLRVALPELFNTTREFLGKVVDPALVEKSTKSLDATFSHTVMADILRYGRQDSDIWFSGHRREDTRQI